MSEMEQGHEDYSEYNQDPQNNLNGSTGDHIPDYSQSEHNQYSEQGGGNRYSTPLNIGSSDPNDTYNVFVGDINLDVTEDDLKETFSPCGPVKSALIFRDRVTNEPKGFGFVHFQTKAAQVSALSEDFNHIMIKGRPCRVKSEQKTTLFVGNIPKAMNVKEVHDSVFNLIGVPVEVELKTGPPPVCESRGFAFVTFGNHQTADKSRKILVSAAIRERPLNVSWAEPQEETDADTMATVRTLYVSNLHANVTDNVLGSLFSQYGVLVNCAIVKNPQTKESRGFAFIEFKTREACVAAMDALNGAQLEGQPMTIVLAKPPPKPNKSDKGCYRCGGDGHISRDCPNDDGSGKGGRRGGDRGGGRDRGRPNSGGGGGGYIKSAPQFNSNGQMNPYIYDPETQQYIYLDPGQWRRIQQDLGVGGGGGGGGGGPQRHGRDDRRSGGGGGGGRDRDRGGRRDRGDRNDSNYATYTATPPAAAAPGGYYGGYDYSQYQYQQPAYAAPPPAGYPPAGYSYDYSQQAPAQPASGASSAPAPAAGGGQQPQYAQAHADYTSTRYAPY